MGTGANGERALLRHAVATVAYRGAKVLRGAPQGFGATRLGSGTRSPLEILAHIGDLFVWARHLAEGRHVWTPEAPAGWEREVERFFGELARFDQVLAATPLAEGQAARLLQGPVADALTHVGQLALLRRRADAPVRGENYFRADIRAGLVGPQQPQPRVEFD